MEKRQSKIANTYQNRYADCITRILYICILSFLPALNYLYNHLVGLK